MSRLHFRVPLSCLSYFRFQAEPSFAGRPIDGDPIVVFLAGQVVDALAIGSDVAFDAAVAAGNQFEGLLCGRCFAIGDLQCRLVLSRAPVPRFFEVANPNADPIVASSQLESVVFAAAVTRPIECMSIADQPLGYATTIGAPTISDQPGVLVVADNRATLWRGRSKIF